MGEKTPQMKPYSGQFRLRLPSVLHEALSREAESQGVSLNSYVMYLLSTRHSQEVLVRSIAERFTGHLEHSMREMHDMVASITVGDPMPEPFRWQAGSTTSLYQC